MLGMSPLAGQGMIQIRALLSAVVNRLFVW